MSLFIRFFDLMTTCFFMLWIILHLLENYDLSAICLAAVLFFGLCMLGLRLLVYFKITSRRLKQ